MLYYGVEGIGPKEQNHLLLPCMNNMLPGQRENIEDKMLALHSVNPWVCSWTPEPAIVQN